MTKYITVNFIINYLLIELREWHDTKINEYNRKDVK